MRQAKYNLEIARRIMEKTEDLRIKSGRSVQNKMGQAKEKRGEQCSIRMNGIRELDCDCNSVYGQTKAERNVSRLK